MIKYILVFIGGGFGSLLRFTLSLTMSKLTTYLPLATLACNVISCCIFGCCIWYYNQKELVPNNYKYLLLIGVCGGLSTFSTFSFETVELIKQGLIGFALANVVLSCVLCFGVFYVLLK